MRRLPPTLRVFTDRAGRSFAVMHACWVNGIDLPADTEHWLRTLTGKADDLEWDDPPERGVAEPAAG